MKMKKKLALLAGVGLAGVSLSSVAATVEGVTINGYMTTGATYADRQLLSETKAVSDDGTIQNEATLTRDTRLGLQITAKVNPDITVAGQLFGSGRSGEYLVDLDWIFLSYRLSNQYTARFGRIKTAHYLASDYIDLGYAYPWIRPPQEVYYSNPLEAINGMDLLARYKLGGYTLLIQPYLGMNRNESSIIPQEIMAAMPLCLTPPPPNGPVTPNYTVCPAGTVMSTEFNTDGLLGLNVNFGTDAATLHFNYMKTRVSAEAFGVVDDIARFGSAGLQVDWKNIVLYNEYFARRIEGLANMAFPNQQGAYATLGYRFGKWMPHLTYAWLDDNGNPPGGLAFGHGVPLKQTSITLGVRRELGKGAALKIEAQQVTPEKGTRGLLIAAPSAAPDSADSVMIYSLAVDLVF